uniref:Remorin C-terminal domain-containing protein n=1 Tax=Davidia involucrata TaxID=16924 RepID=A0A5B6Z911_DAVIN
MPPELGFQDQNLLTSGYRARDFSPDSVIFTVESNFSLFSSASGSVDRCSFASDVHDHDSLVSEISQHFAGNDLPETSSGPDPDPNRSTIHKNSCLVKKVEKAKVQKEDNEAETEDENQTLDSARSSFSQALKECQDRRSRSEALLRKPDRRRPASLDLNNSIANAINSSPRFGVMKKNSVLTRRTGTFPSPGTPNYQHTSVGIQKGWSSERVPLHANANRRHVGAALLPFNSGRTLPSKWEDAERWIFSPVAGDGLVRPSFPQPQRRPKSKSGPLGPPGIVYHSLFSPAVPLFEGGNVGNLMAGSPFSTGVMAADGLSIRCGGDHGGGGRFPEPCMARSVSVHGCSALLSQSSLPGSQDEELDGVKDAATHISRAVSRRDMATQMSPEGSPHSSPKRRPSLSLSTSSALPIVELPSVHSSKLEVRDVQVDERVTVTRWSKKHKARFTGKGSENVDDWKKKAAEARSSAWEVSETAKSISKVKREEAKITAWENLQKAKAEAEIRKLEMKLEKKRSSSMDKIMNKLRSAQRKAQEMRSSVIASQAHQVARTSHKVISFRRTRRISSLSGCFTCHAF